MRKWLENLSSKSEDKSHIETMKRLVYVNRINKRIDRELDNLLWLCRNHPDIFLNAKEDSPNSHMRLKKLLLCIKALNPKCEIELVLRNLKDEEQKKEVRIPYTKTVTLEGLSLVKEEKFQIPLEPLSISKKEVIKLPLTVKELKKKE